MCAKFPLETDVAAANVSEIRAGESTALKGLTVHAVYAKPPEGDASAGIAPPDVTHLGYVIVSNGVTCFTSAAIRSIISQNTTH